MSDLLVFVAFAWVLTSAFIWFHAVEQGKSRLWGVATFFFGIFGLVVYAISLASD